VVLEVHSAKADYQQRAAMKILLVEDTLTNVKVLSTCLRKRDFSNLTVAHNGQEAWDIVQMRLLTATAPTERARTALPFSVELMDCEMPVMRIRLHYQAESQPQSCPIFALTADAPTKCDNNAVQQVWTSSSKPLQANDLIFALGFTTYYNITSCCTHRMY
jgi:CheY-like chemotaxis protein